MTIDRLTPFSTERQNIPGIQPHWGGVPSDKVAECRQLVAKRYAEVGFIGDGDIGQDGGLSTQLDPHVENSEYFWKTDQFGNVIATFRMIHPEVNRELVLPIETSFRLHEEQHTALQQAFKDDPRSVVEISALAKEKGVDGSATLDMYKEVWQHAKKLNLSICAISADQRLHEVLVESFGSAVVQAGDPDHMLGSTTVPSLLYPAACAGAVADIYKRTLGLHGPEPAEQYKAIIGYLIDGLPARYLNAEEKMAFRSMGLEVD